MAKEKTKGPVSVGFGESKMTSVASPEEQERWEKEAAEISERPPRSVWTVEGKLVGEMPDGHLVTWDITDQALAAKARRRETKIAEMVAEGFTREDAESLFEPKLRETVLPPQLEEMRHRILSSSPDEDQKKILRMQDMMADDRYDMARIESALEANPLDAVRSRHERPGHDYVFSTEDMALTNGELGYRPVHDKDGNLVTFRSMTLMERKKEISQMVERIHKRKTDEALSAINQREAEDAEKHNRQIAPNGLSVRAQSLIDTGVQPEAGITLPA